jgi:flagellar L-ring protein FlgH
MVMKLLGLGCCLLGLVAGAPNVCAQSLWERRDPQTAYLFTDTRARHVGDLLTIVVNESTEVSGMDTKALNKATSATGALNIDANAAAGGSMTRTFTGGVDATGTSQRKFDGQANISIDRKLVDRMTVVVVNVFPNGNLLVEGRRTRVISHEERTLVMTGIVRPLDIGAGNVIQSQFIADFCVTYEGQGPESSYTDHGWWGRIMNKIWPF